MSEEHLEIVRRIYREWGQGRFRAGTELFDPSVLLVLRPEFPDAGDYLGVEEVGEYMRGFLEDWDHAAIEGEEFIEAGDTVVVGVHQRAVGKGSGIETDMRYYQLWTFRSEKVIRIESVMERDDALEAAGLSD